MADQEINLKTNIYLFLKICSFQELTIWELLFREMVNEGQDKNHLYKLAFNKFFTRFVFMIIK
jgi:hypothetical protein